MFEDMLETVQTVIGGLFQRVEPPIEIAWWPASLPVWPFGERELFMALMVTQMILGYWIPNAVLWLIYRSGFGAGYKTLPVQVWPPEPLVIKCVVKNIVNTFVVFPVLACFLFYPMWAAVPGAITGPLPDLKTAVLHTVVCWWCADFWFYWGHRASHHRLIYKRVHKMHHEFKATIGVAANYASIAEEVFVNGISTVLGPVLCVPHVLVFSLYMIMRTEESVEEHSGYEFPTPWQLLRSNGHHAFHHSHNVGVYGTFGRFGRHGESPFWDWLCGTDKAYNEYLDKQAAARRRKASVGKRKKSLEETRL